MMKIAVIGDDRLKTIIKLPGSKTTSRDGPYDFYLHPPAFDHVSADRVLNYSKSHAAVRVVETKLEFADLFRADGWVIMEIS